MNSKAIAVLAVSMAIMGCTSSSSQWTRSSWMGQQIREVNSGPWKIAAAPVKGNGFKLKLSISTDQVMSTFRDQPMPPLEESLIEAAKDATPEGCRFKSLEKLEEGGYAAVYDCA